MNEGFGWGAVELGAAEALAAASSGGFPPEGWKSFPSRGGGGGVSDVGFQGGGIRVRVFGGSLAFLGRVAGGVACEMDESNTDVEEGEACYYGAGGAGVDSNIDPDIDLSYIVRALSPFDVPAGVKFEFFFLA